MTERKFFNSIANGKKDVLQILLDVLDKEKINYCVIGGLAVNAYAEPVVSLDVDIVVVASKIDKLIKKLGKSFKIKKFPHSINLISPLSDLRIQLQTDPRYEAFLKHSSFKKVMGYKMRVASIEDVLQGKIWAYSDKKKRESKRQKDLADILRLVEKYPNLKRLLPQKVKTVLF